MCHPGVWAQEGSVGKFLESGWQKVGQSHLLVLKDSCVPHCEGQDESLSKMQISFHWMENVQKFHGTIKLFGA